MALMVYEIAARAEGVNVQPWAWADGDLLDLVAQ
jgi:hypothetical protein